MDDFKSAHQAPQPLFESKDILPLVRTEIELGERLSRKRRDEYELHTQDPTNGADFDYILLRNGVKIPIGSRNIGGMNAALNTDHINK